MALLRFTPENTRILQSEGRDRVEVRIGIAPAVGAELADALGGISEREGSELRTEFPAGWTIYWKIRDGESRFFVAHPETDQWVATLALSRTHFAEIRNRLRAGVSGPLSTLETVSRMSNVEVVLDFGSPSESAA